MGSSPANESHDLEWKEKYSKKEERWADHLSAFANLDGGGCIVFGIEDSGAIVGVQADQARQIEENLRKTGDLSVAPPVTIEAQAVPWDDGKALLFVHVREGVTRPVRTRERSTLTDDKKVCVRRGASTVEASVSEIRQMMMANRPLQWEQLRATKRLSLSDVEHLLDFETLCDLLQKPRPSREALPQWLANERLIDLTDNGAFITNFGAIAAARDLTDFDPLDRKALRIIHYQGLNKGDDTKEEIIIREGYAISFEDTLRKLMKILQTKEEIRGGIRREVHAFPELAVRELLANTLIHQDFHLTGTGPQIEIFDNRVEFYNPGGPVSGVAPDRLIDTGPRSRNEVLARKFREYRLCEERGTGFQKVIKSLEPSGAPPLLGDSYPPVAFRTHHETFRVILYREKPFSELTLDERVEACFQHAVLKHASSAVLTNTTLRERFRLSARKGNDVTNTIGEAVKRGRIKRVNPGEGPKSAKYVPYWA